MKYVGFITLTDPLGAKYYDGTPVPIKHRCYWNGTGGYGTSSIEKLFNPDADVKITAGAIENLFDVMIKSPEGSWDRFTWKHE